MLYRTGSLHSRFCIGRHTIWTKVHRHLNIKHYTWKTMGINIKLLFIFCYNSLHSVEKAFHLILNVIMEDVGQGTVVHIQQSSLSQMGSVGLRSNLWCSLTSVSANHVFMGLTLCTQACWNMSMFLIPQHRKINNTVVCFQLCGNRLGKNHTWV